MIEVNNERRYGMGLGNDYEDDEGDVSKVNWVKILKCEVDEWKKKMKLKWRWKCIVSVCVKGWI